jgi:nicotinic acid mononucleotide adenylyltransferase
MLLTLSEWYRPEVIFKYATICYVRREKDPETTRLINEKIKYYQEHYSARII